jgi:uncharacterized protein
MMLTFNVLSLTEEPWVASAEVPARDLDLDADLRVEAPVGVEVELQRLGEKIHIKGAVSARIRLECARCLNEFILPIQADLDLVALPADSESRPAKLAEENPEEEDTSFMAYKHDQVELLPEVRSILILAVPMKPLCEENCPGLCPDCGIRLDETDQ